MKTLSRARTVEGGNIWDAMICKMCGKAGESVNGTKSTSE